MYGSREIKDSSSRNITTENHLVSLDFKIKPKNLLIRINSSTSFTDISALSSLVNHNYVNGAMISIIKSTKTTKNAGFNGNYNLNWTWKISHKLSVGSRATARISNNAQHEQRKDTTLNNSTYSYIHLSGPTDGNNVRLSVSPLLSYELSRYNTVNLSLTRRREDYQGQKVVVDNLTGKYDYSQMYNYTDRSVKVIPDFSLIHNKGQLRFVMGVRGQKSTQKYSDSDKGIDKSNVFFALLPNFSIDRNAILNTRSSRLLVAYQSMSSLPASNMLTTAINSNGSSYLTVGNPDLKQSFSHNISASLSLMENNITASTYIKGAYVTNPIGLNGFEFFERDSILEQYGNYTVRAGSLLSSYINGEDRYYINPGIEMKFPLNFMGSILGTGIDYKYEFSPVLIGNTLIKSHQQALAFSLSFKSNFSEHFELIVDSKSSFSFNKRNNGTKDKFFSQQLSATINASLLSDRVRLSAHSNTYVSRNPYSRNTNQTINLLNASIDFKFMKERNAGFGISVHDMLNSGNIFNVTTSAQSQSSRWSQSLGRYIMVNFSYKFNYKKSPTVNEE